MAPDIQIVHGLDLDTLPRWLDVRLEGGTPEPYEVVSFGPAGRLSYMRFVGEKAIG